MSPELGGPLFREPPPSSRSPGRPARYAALLPHHYLADRVPVERHRPEVVTGQVGVAALPDEFEHRLTRRLRLLERLEPVGDVRLLGVVRVAAPDGMGGRCGASLGRAMAGWDTFAGLGSLSPPPKQISLPKDLCSRVYAATVYAPFWVNDQRREDGTMMRRGVWLVSALLFAACSGDTPVSQDASEDVPEIEAPTAEAQLLPLEAAPTKGSLRDLRSQVTNLPVGSCIANFGGAPGEFYVLRFRLGVGGGDSESAEVRTKAFRDVQGRLLVRISCRYVPSERADHVVDKVLDWAPGRGGAMQALRGRVQRNDPVSIRGRGPRSVDGIVATVCQEGEGWVYWPYLDDCVCEAGPDQCDDSGDDETDIDWGDGGNGDDDDGGPGGGPVGGPGPTADDSNNESCREDLGQGPCDFQEWSEIGDSVKTVMVDALRFLDEKGGQCKEAADKVIASIGSNAFRGWGPRIETSNGVKTGSSIEFGNQIEVWRGDGVTTADYENDVINFARTFTHEGLHNAWPGVEVNTPKHDEIRAIAAQCAEGWAQPRGPVVDQNGQW